MLHPGSGHATFICGQSFPEFLLLQLPRDELDTVIDTILPLEKKSGRFLAQRGGRTGRVNEGLCKLKATDGGEGP